MAEVKRPVLLNSDLSESMILYPSKAQLTLNLNGVSTCQLTMAKWSDSLTQIRMHSWIKIYNQHGFVGIFRRTSANKNIPSDHTIQLRHGIDILQDSLWMTETDFSGSTTSFLTALLNQQTALINGVKPWVLGTCEDTSTIQRKISYNNLLELITGMEDPAGDYYFTYDQTDFPWVLNYVRKSTEPECEFRLSRNLTKVRISENDSELCTRLILNINQMVTITDQDAGDSRQENQSTKTVYNNTAAQAVYGIITKTTDIDLADHPEGAAAFAQKFLKDRSAPLLQIQADGYDLKSVTGFDWDETQLGKLCQVAVPDYDTAYTERVVTVQYPDLLGQPCTVSVSLANALPKLTHSSTSTQREARETAKEQREQERETQTIKSTSDLNLIRTDYAGDVFRQAGLVIDPSGVLIFAKEGLFDTQFAQIDVRADQIQQTVSRNRSDMDQGFSQITQRADSIAADVVDLTNATEAHFKITDEAITSEVTRATEAEGVLSSSITQTATEIRSEVSNSIDGVNSRITQTAGEIRSEVSNSVSGLSSRISQTESDIELNAKNIKIIADDYVTINDLDAKVASIEMAIADKVDTAYLYATTGTLNQANIYDVKVDGTAVGVHTISVDGTQVASYVGTADVNFDRAAAKKEGADSVTLSSAGWQSGGRNVVSATNGQSLTVNLPSFTSSQTEWNSSYQKTVYFDTPSVSVPLKSETIDASSVYDGGYSAGYRDGVNSVTLSNSDIVLDGSDYISSTKKYNVYVEATASNGAQGTQTLSVDASDAYNAGYSAGETAGIAAGKAASGVVVNTSNKTVSVTVSDTKSVTVSAEASIGYSSSTHKYTATGKAKAGGSNMDSATATSGTEAYDAGVADGKAAAGVDVNTSNKTVYVTTSTTKSVTVSAVAEISYNSSTHKYTAIGRARAGGKAMDYASAVSGTEAYQAGIDSVDTQSYYNNGYNAGFTSGWQSYYNASGWNRNSNGSVMIPAASGSGSEVWFDLADELPSVTFNWWNPAKGVAGVYFYIWGKYYGTSHTIPPGWM